MPKLKRCPFCGGQPHFDFGHGGNVMYWGKDGFEKRTQMLYRVFCGSCSCSTALAESTDVAAMIWNRRLADE